MNCYLGGDPPTNSSHPDRLGSGNDRLHYSNMVIDADFGFAKPGIQYK
jgi:hypothetical protein